MTGPEDDFFKHLEKEMVRPDLSDHIPSDDAIKFAQERQLEIARLETVEAKNNLAPVAINAVNMLYGSSFTNREATLFATGATLYRGPQEPVINLKGDLHVDGSMQDFIYAQLFGQRTIALVMINTFIEMEEVDSESIPKKAAPLLIPVLHIDNYSYL